MDTKRLYIPYGLSSEQEYFTGFGRSELKQCFVGMAAFAIISAFAYVISGQIEPIVIIMIIGAAGCIMMTRRDPHTRISVVGQVVNMIRFSRTQKIYKYICKSPWS